MHTTTALCTHVYTLTYFTYALMPIQELNVLVDEWNHHKDFLAQQEKRIVDTKVAPVKQCEKQMLIFIEIREQAVRDKAAEVLNIKRVGRLYNELAEAPSIIERVLNRDERSY